MIRQENQKGVFMLFSQFQKKEVINIQTCKKIGNVSDIEFDHCTGQIHKLFISKGFQICNLFCPTGDIVICYNDIKQIGPDIILVDICSK